jgi:aconitate hydratase
MNSFKSLSNISTKSGDYKVYDINKIDKDVNKMPFSTKILLENLLRNEDGICITKEMIDNFLSSKDIDIEFFPARVLMQDFTGVPAVVDLASMRDAMTKNGKNPDLINPKKPTHLVIDHSIQVDKYGTNDSLIENERIEFERNKERYKFLKWGQQSLSNFFLIPPGNGICHQVNLEFISKIAWSSDENGQKYAYPDTLVGTDSHTTMVNGISVLGWGVGGIEAESVMLGQSISMVKPRVVGMKLIGKAGKFVTSTDIVLTITNILRKHGVVNKFVEFYGEGARNLSVFDRATIANMAPEYGATCGFFRTDDSTFDYLYNTGRSEEDINLVKEYSRLQGLYDDGSYDECVEFDEYVELDLSSVKTTLAGPKRPQDKVLIEDVSKNYLSTYNIDEKNCERHSLSHGSVAIAAITSCTNTSNPYVLIGAGLLAKKAIELGLKTKEYVKTSLAPGSKVVSEYLKQSGLQVYLDQLGFNVVGYGCTTCIGNSGPLKDEYESEIKEKNYNVAAVISGNRNFEGRVHPLVKANYLASPILVVAYAIAGNISIDLSKQPIGKSNDGKDVYLSDIFPSMEEIEDVVKKNVTREMFISKYKDVFNGDESWNSLEVEKSSYYEWDKMNTYIENPPYFSLNHDEKIKNGRILGIFGDSITTDHISPAGNIALKSPAGQFLIQNGVEYRDFNSYGARRGSHSVMMRGTFANIRLKNLMVDVEGGYSKNSLGNVTSIYDAAMSYNCPLVIFAGKEYGTGSSRDWAAKGTLLLGVRAVIAESFERIHRSNLVGMGVLPCELMCPLSDLNLVGEEGISIIGTENISQPGQILHCIIKYKNGIEKTIKIKSRIDTKREVEFYNKKGIMNYVMDNL